MLSLNMMQIKLYIIAWNKTLMTQFDLIVSEARVTTQVLSHSLPRHHPGPEVGEEQGGPGTHRVSACPSARSPHSA